MHKIGVAAIAAVAVLAAGCAQSKVPTDAKVTLTGKVLRQDGTAAGNLRLALTRVPDPGELVFQGIPVAATLGVACLADDPPPLCKLVQRATTDPQGTYAVHMTGADVQGTFNTATNFDLTAQLPRTGSEVDGPSVRAAFQIQRTDLTVPPLRFWEPDHVTVQGDARNTTLDWASVKDVNDYTAHFSVGGQEIWSGPAKTTVDSRLLEDANGVVHISMAAGAPGPDTTFQLFYTSQGTAFRGTAGAPESRGRRCLVQGPAAQPRPCTLTDGAFNHPLDEPPCPDPSKPCDENGWVLIDLGRSEPVGTVVARANPGGRLMVQTSEDQVDWTDRGQGDGEFPTIALPGEVTARYVRVQAPPGSKLTGLTQLSVWP